IPVSGQLTRTSEGTPVRRQPAEDVEQAPPRSPRPDGPWHLTAPVSSAQDNCAGIETPVGQSSYGWGDYRASWQFALLPKAVTGSTEPDAPPSPPQPPASAICFLGTTAADPAAGVAIHLTPSTGRVCIVKGRVLLLLA